MRTESLAQRGMATLGYYTNVGTVFTAATTHWANHLADTDVATVTGNVLDDLRTRHSRATWTLASRTYPTTTWSSLGTLTGTVPAITGIVEGHAAFQTATSGYISRVDPENPTSGSSTTSIPALSTLSALGSDLWAQYIFAGASDGKVYYRNGKVSSGETWTAQSNSPISAPSGSGGGQVWGIGGFDRNFFASYLNGSVSMLYRCFDPTGTPAWTLMGRAYPPIRAITYFDGKLFGVRYGGANTTDPLDLYCREASEVDLTWTKIGTAPAATYSLAAYYGRLFALAGSSTTNPTLHWRSTIASGGSPYRAPSMLFLNGASYSIGRLSSNGDFETTGSGTLGFSYTHATRANDGIVFFYNSANGSARVGRFAADGTYTNLKTYASSSFGTWTHVVSVRSGNRTWTDLSDVQDKVLFYNSAGTSVYIGYFNTSTGDFVSQWNNSGFATGWTKIACTYKGDVLFYNGTSGTYAYGLIADNGTYTAGSGGSGFSTGWDAIVPAGNTYLYFYKTDGTAALIELLGGVTGLHSYSSLPTSRLVAGAANGVVLSYSASGGDAEVHGFTSSGTASAARLQLRSYPGLSFASSWQIIVPLGIL